MIKTKIKGITLIFHFLSFFQCPKRCLIFLNMSIPDWLKANKLTLNVGKSNLILFKSPRKKVTKSIILKIDKKQIKETEYRKYLGVLLDNWLSWRNQLYKPPSRKINLRHWYLTKLRKFVSKDILKSLYFAFIQSHIVCLYHGVLLWTQPLRKLHRS